MQPPRPGKPCHARFERDQYLTQQSFDFSSVPDTSAGAATGRASPVFGSPMAAGDVRGTLFDQDNRPASAQVGLAAAVGATDPALADGAK